ncbi:synaptic vesicle 2-related protein isoform X2 [Lingula anatina]|uniref:Synaptic vesicle 2-related protein isoform X2 n=1 Tax=Lingula anatina TaxID=7574 RepID=A0A1S3I3N1_LINAN|nr:synaptic vesicle 2-related protein isoform X2 [Lingula anatina]|eukprot:XP_013392843.1 synaptic vesicle 2-related protein isoform X2 [Lingula anatina]
MSRDVVSRVVDHLPKPFVKIRRQKYEDLDEATQPPADTAARTESVEFEAFPPEGDGGDPGAPKEDTFTVEQAVDAIGFGKFQIKLSLLTGLAWMSDAMEMMILSILGPALHCDWDLEDWEKALITTIVFVGMMVSSGLWGTICDKYGRRMELILSSVFTFYYGLVSSFSPVYVWMLILRGLVGFGIGGAPQSVTLYAEFLPSASRAKCVVLIEIFWAIGTCFEVLLALIVMPNLGWRWLLGFSALPLLIFTLACVWLPESARFDMARGRSDKALATLQRIAKDNNKPMPLGKLVHSGPSSVDPTQIKAKRGRLKDLFTPEMRVTTFMLWIIWFANAFSYYGIVLLTTELFESGETCHVSGKLDAPSCSLECKVLTTKDYVDLLWTTLAEFPGLILTVFIIDPLGRKKTMGFEFLVFSLFTFLICTCPTRGLLIFFIFVARAFISGAFQACYVYTPEVYPTTTRAIGLGTCSAMARIGAIVTPFVAQVLLRTSVYLTASIYGGVCIAAAIASFLLPIETKGREMKESHVDTTVDVLPPVVH